MPRFDSGGVAHNTTDSARRTPKAIGDRATRNCRSQNRRRRQRNRQKETVSVADTELGDETDMKGTSPKKTLDTKIWVAALSWHRFDVHHFRRFVVFRRPLSFNRFSRVESSFRRALALSSHRCLVGYSLASFRWHDVSFTCHALPFSQFLTFLLCHFEFLMIPPSRHCFAVLTITLFHCFVLLRFPFVSLPLHVILLSSSCFILFVTPYTFLRPPHLGGQR